MKATLRLGACAAALAALPALAQDRDLVGDEIIVTATKRESTLQDVPFSVNAQTQNDIQRSGSQTLEDVARNVAGLTIQNLGPGQSQVAIRGVSAGQIVRDQPGVKEQVGIYLDESVISLSLFTPDLDLFDLDRLETLRGPQGTLFGSGSIGGTIRYITNRAEIGVTEGLVEADINQVEEGGLGGHLKGAVNLPIGENAALRLVGYHTEYGGFIDALRQDTDGAFFIEDDVNSGSRSGGRAELAWEPTDRLRIAPRVIYQEIETDGFNRQEAFNIFANPFTTTRPPVELGEREQFLLLDEAFEDDFLLVDLSVDYDIGEATLTSITSYTDRSVLVSRDASALTGSVSIDLGFPDEAALLPSNLRDTTDVEQWTQEVRIANNDDDRFDWVAGIFLSDTQRSYAQRLPTPGYDAFTDDVLGEGTAEAVSNGFPVDSPFNSDLPYSLEQVAVFGEGTYDLTDRFRVTAGARYYDFSEERTISTGGLFASGDQGVRDRTSSNGVNPRFIAAFDATDQVTLLAQAAKGFRLGGVNDPLNVPLCSEGDREIFGGFQSFDDETLWNYEAGVKVNTPMLRFNANAFYADISDLQVTLDAGSCSSRVVFNVPEAHSMGVELETEIALGENFELSVAGSLLESEFDSTVTDADGNILGGIEEGNRLPSVPEFQIAAAASWFFDGGAFGGEDGYVTLTAQHVGSRFTQPGDQVPGAGDFVSNLPFGGAPGTDVTSLDLELDSYQIVNLTTGMQFGSVELAAYVTNILDENADLSFDRERGGRARLGFQTNQPRTYGVTVRKRF
jgi:iron complex outermembrane receptor protein